SATGREELEAVYSELDQLEPNRRDERTYRPRQALFMWPAAVALALSVLVAILGLVPSGSGVNKGHAG
ncbi:MAG: BatB protein, partial [Anaerolineae bacterium]